MKARIFLAAFLTLALSLFALNAPRAQFFNPPLFMPTSATYQGPGDVFSGAIGWWSAARAYNAAYAAAQSPLFDIVDITTGLAACTVNAGANGFANQTAAVCPTGAPAVNIVTFCTITHAGGCKFTQLYDQTGSGNPL